MPISPSDLPWWGWFLCSIGAGIICAIASALADTSKGSGFLAGLIALVSGLVGLIAGAIAIIRFVKWVWAS